jgi:hypothetical protein
MSQGKQLTLGPVAWVQVSALSLPNPMSMLLNSIDLSSKMVQESHGL